MKNLIQKKINIFENVNQNKFSLTNAILLKNQLTNALRKKELLASGFNISQATNNLIVNINGFVRTSKLLKYRRIVQHSSASITTQRRAQLNDLFVQNFNNALKQNNIVLNYTNVNQSIKKKLLLKNSKIFSKFRTALFLRGFNLYIDFLKVLTLLEEKKIETKTFLIILSQIFKNVNKRRHTKFIFFIKTIIKILLNSPARKILGIKLQIKGKISGKTRAGISKMSKGSLAINSRNSGCVEERVHTYTIYGAFGFKLWINYRN